jgi:hypothetical protein
MDGGSARRRDGLVGLARLTSRGAFSTEIRHMLDHSGFWLSEVNPRTNDVCTLMRISFDQ